MTHDKPTDAEREHCAIVGHEMMSAHGTAYAVGVIARERAAVRAECADEAAKLRAEVAELRRRDPERLCATPGCGAPWDEHRPHYDDVKLCPFDYEMQNEFTDPAAEQEPTR